MKHFRANLRTYLAALVGICALTAVLFLVLMPMPEIALHLFSPFKVITILLISGAVLRFLLHAVDNVDRQHDRSTSSNS